MKRFLLTHDIGTTFLKATLFDAEGHLVNKSSAHYELAVLRGNRTEQDSEDWWQAFCRTTRSVLAGIRPEDVAAVAVSGQMMVCLPTDSNGNAIFPAITAADGRSSKELHDLLLKISHEEYQEIVGIPPSENYTLAKILWLKKEHPEIYKRAYKFLSSKDYINLKLTGVYATDPLDATYMHLYDRKRGTWSNRLLEVSGIDPEKLPTILESGTVIGPLLGSAADECGLLAGTPVIMSTGDGGTATLGTGTLLPGDAYLNIGTSSWVCAITTSGNLTDRTLSLARYFSSWRLSGTMQAGGYSYNWLKNILFPDGTSPGEDPYITMDLLSAKVPAGSNGVMFFPYLMGERTPYWDMKLKGAFFGLSSETGRKELCRSVMEGTAFHLSMILGRLQCAEGVPEIKKLRIMGGGAKSPVWRQIIADMTQLPIETVLHPDEAGAAGSAVISGIAVGLFSGLQEISRFQKAGIKTEPNSENFEIYQKESMIFQSSFPMIRDLSHSIASLAGDNKNE